MKNILKYLVVMMVAFIVANLLLFLVCLIPRDCIEENFMESASVLIQRGNKYRILDFFICDNYTEAEIVNEIYSVDSENPVFSYLTMRRCYDPKFTKNEIENPNGKGIELLTNGNTSIKKVSLSREMSNFIDGKISTAVRYGRYWHGYMVLYRPLFIFFNMVQVRIITLGTILLLLIFNFNEIKKKFDLPMAGIFLTILVLGGCITASIQLQLFPIFLIGLIANLLVLKNKLKFNYLFAFTLGIIVNYFDYFTIPLFAICLPMIFYLLDNPKNSFKEYFAYIVKMCFFFFIGWSIMWGMKFVLYYFLVDNNFIYNIFNQIKFRASMNDELGDNAIGNGIIRITFRLSLLLYPILIPMLFKWNAGFSKDKAKTFSYLMLFVILPCSYLFVLLNHTVACWSFTYKDLIIAGLAINYYLYKVKIWDKSLVDVKNDNKENL